MGHGHAGHCLLRELWESDEDLLATVFGARSCVVMIAFDLDDCAQLSSEPAQPQTPNGKSNEEFQPVHDTLPTPRLQLQKPWTPKPTSQPRTRREYFLAQRVLSRPFRC